MFNRAIRGQTIPKYLSSDHDPLYRFHQWQANLRVLGITEITTVPYVPISHPFVERLIGTIRREYLDRTLFWTAVDLESKLSEFKDYYNRHRTHASLAGKTPEEASWRQCVRDVEVISMEKTLSRIISDAQGGIITNSPCTALALLNFFLTSLQ